MNERIKLLAEQAESQVSWGDPSNRDDHNRALDEWQEKFAELIVKECADIFEGVYTDQQRPERIDTRIKQHFGVEE